MTTANFQINNYVLLKILKMFKEVNNEVTIIFSKDVEIRAMDKPHCQFFFAKMNNQALRNVSIKEDFEIFFDSEKLRLASEKSTASEISLIFSDLSIVFKEESPSGSVFNLKVYSDSNFKFQGPKFQEPKRITINSTHLLEGIKKLSIISHLIDIANKDNKVIFRSQDILYGEGNFAIGESDNFSSNSQYFNLSSLKNILENVPENTVITLEIDKQKFLRLTFSFAHVSFTLYIAPSLE